MAWRLEASPQPRQVMESYGTPAHIRSCCEEFVQLVRQGVEMSPTFRRMIAAIDRSDSYAFLSKGECAHILRACLVNVSSSESYRYIFINIKDGLSDNTVIVSVGHELAHALEVIDAKWVVDTRSLRLLYIHIGTMVAPFAYETKEAVRIEQAVTREIDRFKSRRKTAERSNRPGTP